MKDFRLKQDPKAAAKFKTYPKSVKPKMERLRKLVLQVAEKSDSIKELEETLKWGEPSYIAKNGSTLRMDWKEKTPEQYAMYFQCTSKLVPTFKAVFGPTFKYEGTRALVFDLKQKLPEKELKECIRLTLHYHELKDEPLLGMGG